MILCLDLGTVTGWALGDASFTQSGRQEFKPRAKSYAEDGTRYLAFRAWLQNFKTRQGLASGHNAISAVYYERVSFVSTLLQIQCWAGLRAILQAFCEQHQIRCEGVPIGTIKKSATGKGNAEKKHMKAWAVQNGFSPADDNEADALAILSWARKRNFGAFDPGTELALGEPVAATGLHPAQGNPF